MIHILDYVKNRMAKKRIALINKELYIDAVKYYSMDAIKKAFPTEGEIYFGDVRKHCKGENKDKTKIPK
jgi:hypothetical protein